MQEIVEISSLDNADHIWKVGVAPDLHSDIQHMLGVQKSYSRDSRVGTVLMLHCIFYHDTIFSCDSPANTSTPTITTAVVAMRVCFHEALTWICMATSARLNAAQARMPHISVTASLVWRRDYSRYFCYCIWALSVFNSSRCSRHVLLNANVYLKN